MGNLASLIVPLGGDATQLFATLTESQNKVKAWNDSVTSLIKSIAVAAPFAALGKNAFDAAVSVDESFRRIQLSTGAVGERLKGLQESFKNIYKQSPADSEAIVSAMTVISQRSGLTGAALEKLTMDMMRVAKVAQTDVKAIAPAMTRVFGDWGIATEKQSSAMRYLTAISQQTGAQIPQLLERIVFYGAPLRQMGFNFEQAAVMMAKFEAEGVNVETVMGGMRKTLNNLLKAGMEPAQAFNQLIIGVKDGTITAAQAMQFFGAKAGADLYASIREGRWDDVLQGKLQKVAEAATKAQDPPKSLASQWKVFGHEVELALLPIGQPLVSIAQDALNAMRPLVGKVTELSEWFNRLPAGVRLSAEALVGVGLAVGVVTKAMQTLLAFGPAISIVSALAAAVQTLSLAVSTGLVGAMTAGEVALGGFAVALAPIAGAFVGYQLGKVIWGVADAEDALARAQRDQSFAAQKLAEAQNRAALETHGLTINSGSAGLALDLFGEKAKKVKEHIENFRLESQTMASVLGRIGMSTENWAWLEVIGEKAQAAAKRIQEIYLNAQRLKQENFTFGQGIEGVEGPKPKLEDLTSPIPPVIIPSLPGIGASSKEAIDAFGRIEELYQREIISAAEYEAAIEEWARKYPEAARASEAAGKIAVGSTNQMSQAMREVSTILTDMSRGIADAIVNWKGLGDVGIKVAKDIASAIIRNIIQDAFGKMSGAITGCFGQLKGLGSVVGAIFGGASSAAGGAASAAGSVASSAGGAASSAVGAVSSGITGIVGAVGSAVSAISGVIGNFQMMGMNKSLDILVKHTLQLVMQGEALRPTISDRLVAVHDRLMEFRTYGIGVFPQEGYAWSGGLGGGGNTFVAEINGGYFMSPRAQEDFFESFLKFLRNRGVNI